jgi:hypothetical protein
MAIHYWDAKITTMALDAKTGVIADASPRSVLMRPEAAYVDDAKPTREEHWKYRQKWAHSHCVVTEPYFGLVHFVVDLGLDRVFAYRVDAQKGALVQKGVIALPKGKGPRHLVFHPSRRAAYLVNELDSTVSCFRVRLPSRWLANDGPGDEETGEESCSTPGRDAGARVLRQLPACFGAGQDHHLAARHLESREPLERDSDAPPRVVFRRRQPRARQRRRVPRRGLFRGNGHRRCTIRRDRARRHHP